MPPEAIAACSRICEHNWCVTTIMPRVELVFFKEGDGSVPFLEWFDGLQARAQDKCRVRLERLQQLGHELRRPEADFLRDGIYELRVGVQGMNYRMLYFFTGEK